MTESVPKVIDEEKKKGSQSSLDQESEKREDSKEQSAILEVRSKHEARVIRVSVRLDDSS